MTNPIASLSENSNKIWILIATILASGMGSIDSSALNIALPAIQKAFQASTTQLLWVINAYTLMLASLILIGGSLGDRYGRKRIFLMGIFLFLLSSLACGFSTCIELLIFSRTIQGIGGALMIPGSLAIISSSFEGEEKGNAIGIWSASGALLFVLGPPLGGFFSSLGWWRSVFFINLPLGLVCLFLVYFKIPESRDEVIKGKLDLFGMVLISIGLGSLTYGFTHIAEPLHGNLLVVYSLILGLFCMVAFLLVERKASSPLIPLFFFQSAQFSGTNILTFFLYGALGVFTFFFPINLVQIQGYGFSQTGLAFLAFPLPLILLSQVMGKWSSKIGPKIFLVLGPIIVALAFMILSRIGISLGPKAYFSTFFPPLLLLGFGMSVTVAPLTNAVMSSLPNHFSGIASGINNAITRMAFVLIIALVGSISISFFSSHFQTFIQGLNLRPSEFGSMTASSNKMMETPLPRTLNPIKVHSIRIEMEKIFIQIIQFQLVFCACLALSSAFLASIFLNTKTIDQKPLSGN